MLRFDADTLKLLDVSYRGADITRRRMENMAALAPEPGERILDLGCGQGLMTQELSRAVGPDGTVIGLDPSPDMRAGAEERCVGQANVEIMDGGAGDIPVENDSLDAAVSLQVFEYLDDIPGALRNLHQKLKPGGRLIIGDMQWDTLSWASDNPERMRNMQLAWEKHVTEPNLPSILPMHLRSAGFQVLGMRPVPFAAVHLRPDSLPFMIMHLMRGYVIENQLVAEDDVNAWFEEQNKRAMDGQFFFSITHFIAIAIRL